MGWGGMEARDFQLPLYPQGQAQTLHHQGLLCASPRSPPTPAAGQSLLQTGQSLTEALL